MNERRFQITDDLQRQRMKQFIDRRELPFQVEVGPLKEQRSLSQNARLWKLHTIAGEATGNTPEDMHEEMLCKFFGYTEKKMPTGWMKRIPLKRSSARDKSEFRKFLDDVENFYASELGVWLGMDEEIAA